MPMRQRTAQCVTSRGINSWPGKARRPRTASARGARERPDWPEALHCLGVALAGGGRHAEAVECFRLCSGSPRTTPTPTTAWETASRRLEPAGGGRGALPPGPPAAARLGRRP